MTTDTRLRETIEETRSLGRVSGARGLRITQVDTILLSHTYPPNAAPHWSGGQMSGVTAGLVRIHAGDGLYGLGETYAANFVPGVVEPLVDHYAELLVGCDPSDITGLWERCYTSSLYCGRSGFAVSVLSAIECALWDLCGKATGQPVWALLGGAHADSIPYYASGGVEADPDLLRAELEGYLARGFPAVKIRGGVDPEADQAKVGLARQVLGEGVALAVDAVQGSNPNPWPAHQAIAAGSLLEPFDLLWYEEPCGGRAVEDYAECRGSLRMPIAGGETLTTIAEFLPFLEARALDVVQPDASHSGGILEALKVARVADLLGSRCAVHAWASGVCVMANYHLGFAAANCDWLEYPTQANPLIRGLMAQDLAVEDGRVGAPRRPGLGVELAPDLEERYPYRPGNRYRFEERR
jgi:L-alanine-DL-glutamate epimerase-like enolase superfamily enzyme